MPKIKGVNAENPVKSRRKFCPKLFFMHQKLKQKVAPKCDGGRNHSKNAANPKSLISRKNFNSKSLFVTLMFICFCSSTVYAQDVNPIVGLLVDIFVKIFIVLPIILGVIVIRHIVRKDKARTKKSQPIFNEIFKQQGFSATDVICTNCYQIIRRNTYEYIVHNVVIGVKDNTLSFFGGGSKRVGCGIIDKKILFFDNDSEYYFDWMGRRTIGQPEDMLLFDVRTARVIFPKAEEKKFRYLFDIPIDNIESIEGMERSQRIEIFIEHSGELLTLVPYCKNSVMALETANTICVTLEDVMKNTLASTKIYKTNLAITNTFEKDKEIRRQEKLGMIRKVVSGTILVGGAATGAGFYNWKKDR